MWSGTRHNAITEPQHKPLEADTMIPMMILFLTNGTQYVCSQAEADRWMNRPFLAKTVVRSEYL